MKELKTALDSDNLLMVSYYFFGIIAVFVAVGLTRDYIIHWRKQRRARESAAQGMNLGFISFTFKHIYP